MPKNVIFNLLLIVVAFVAVFVGASFLGGATQTFINWGVGTFAATYLSVFWTAASTSGPVGTSSSWTLKKSLAVTAVVSILVGLLFGGVIAAVGALVGTVGTLLRFRGAL
ncbi:MAG: hypothetical protein SGJ27_09865 [Candidatus Melainabacteria bacterium]|nr:hypothetical protein [Candidatus Melainabacteria bacterium]